MIPLPLPSQSDNREREPGSYEAFNYIEFGMLKRKTTIENAVFNASNIILPIKRRIEEQKALAELPSQAPDNVYGLPVNAVSGEDPSMEISEYDEPARVHDIEAARARLLAATEIKSDTETFKEVA